MFYRTNIINKKADLDLCPVFNVDNFLWTCRQTPETFGQMAYLSGEGLYLQMTCNEANPKRELKSHHDMVCKDSAMEVFLAFPDPDLGRTEASANDCLYLNFEINANGAMYAKYGYGRKNRRFITDDEYFLTGVEAAIEAKRWTVRLLIPNLLLRRVAGIRGFKEGNTFFCNFYKISEDPEIEHYAAYSPIVNETPNFHLPEYFARAQVFES